MIECKKEKNSQQLDIKHEKNAQNKNKNDFLKKGV
jgi:hypothetical protein